MKKDGTISRNKTQEIKNRMAELIAERTKELEAIEEEITKTQEYRSELMADLDTAAAQLDLANYENAKENLKQTEVSLEMYFKRLKQIQAKKVISEEESDRVIDSLLRYEESLAEDFKKDIAAPLKQLADILEAYRAEVREAEETLTNWQRDIHANYISRGGAMYYDEMTESYTERSKTPVQVHGTPYTGCSEAEVLGIYLRKAESLYRDK